MFSFFNDPWFHNAKLEKSRTSVYYKDPSDVINEVSAWVRIKKGLPVFEYNGVAPISPRAFTAHDVIAANSFILVQDLFRRIIDRTAE